MRLHKLDFLTLLATVFAAVGALNWGSFGLLRFNVVRRVFARLPAAEQATYGLVGLAGAWLALQLAIPRLAIVLSSRGHGPATGAPQGSIVGQRLPHVEGRALSGKHVGLPEDVAGKPAFLTMGFAYEARWDVEDWVDAFLQRFGDRGIPVFEMPMIGGIARLAAPMIDAGMRAGTPVDFYDRVVTVYAPMRPIRKALHAEHSDTWVYLVNSDGKVIFQCEGARNEAKFAQLAGALESTAAPMEREVGK